jgi:hypothetical protein
MSGAESGGRIVGTAIYFVSFSTWTGRHGLYLDDLVVNEAHRSSMEGRTTYRLSGDALAELAEAPEQLVQGDSRPNEHLLT